MMREAICIRNQRDSNKLVPRRIHRLYSNKAYVQARNILEVTELLGIGARVPLVCKLTQIRMATARSLYRQIHGVPSASGQSPFTDAWFLKSDYRQLHANLIWHLHEALDKSKRSNARILIDVYSTYMRIAPNPIINIERAAFVSKLITLCLWIEKKCQECGLLYITPSTYLKDICPGCRLYLRKKKAVRANADV